MDDYEYLNSYRYDNDDGSEAFFDARAATGFEGKINPEDFDHIFTDQKDALEYLQFEIETRKGDGLPYEDYEKLLREEVKNPVIVVIFKGKAVIWDGYHRVASCVANNRKISAFYCVVD